MDFKKGPFTMAASAGVRVVPVSIVGTTCSSRRRRCCRWRRRGVRIVVHPPLDAPAKKKEGDTMEATKAAVLSAPSPSRCSRSCRTRRRAREKFLYKRLGLFVSFTKVGKS